MAGITGVDGLASGIQTTQIVDAMISAQRNATTVQESRKALLEARLEAVRGFNTRMLGAQLELSNLRSGAAFNTNTATSSNSGVLSATANSSAVAGSYNLNVTKMASAHQLAAAGQASRSANLGSGTITLQMGNGAPVELSVSSDSSSLDAIARQISDAGLGVTAYVVQQDGADPYRLVLQSQQTGLSSAITISADGDLAGLFSGMETLSAADDAQIQMGSGSLIFSSSTNQFTNVIPGVTINAASTGSSTLTVGRDVSGAAEAITSFMESMNQAIDYLRANTEVDLEGGQSGILLSETDLRRGLDSVIRQIFTAVPGLPTSMNNVTSIGIGIDRTTGQLTVDQGVLSAKLTSDPNGVAKLFNNSGVSSDPGIEFASMGAATKATQPFTVDITQAARRAETTGANLSNDPIVIDASNRAFGLSVNGRSYAMNLAEGTYSSAQLVAHLQAVLDGELGPQDKVNVGVNGDGQVQLSTQRFGSAATLRVDASSANGVFGFSTGLTAGANVVGTINGQAATGSGQILTGTSGDAEGLALIVRSTTPVSNATLSVNVGLGTRLGSRFSALTDSQSGAITAKENSLTSSISNIQEQVRRVDERLELRREGLLRQFRTMETLIGQFQSQQSFLEGSIAAWNNLARSVGSNRRN
ncbi:MAG: hypothetical protein EA402_04915 [Planctomycetota bacterium]|nr:MAG: hypothetical protein EA402_04915 [Planctomycetota bacterium]